MYGALPLVLLLSLTDVASVVAAPPTAPVKHSTPTQSATSSILSATRLGAVSFADSTHGWAGGYAGNEGMNGHGVLLATSDGGSTWALQAVPSDLAAVNAMSFPNASDGWAVGIDRAGSPEVIATTTGGARWTRQAVLGLDAEQGSFAGVSFVDAAHGWIVGSTADTLQTLLYSTSDGGATWSDQSAPTVTGADPISAMSFGDSRHGWLATNTQMAGSLFSTADGGHSWARQSNITFGGPIAAITFVDAMDGFIAVQGPVLSTHPGAVAVTHDGGATWQTTPVATNTVLGLAAMDARHAAVLGGGPNVRDVDSTSDGSTWSDTSAQGANAQAIAIAGGRLVVVGVLPCGGASAQYSTDAGATWTQSLATAAEANVNIVQVLGIDPLTVSANTYCNGFEIQRTVNGATTTIPDPPGITQLGGAAFPTPTTGWVVGGGPTTNGGQVWKTLDGGATWQQLSLADPTAGTPVFYDTEHGVVVGYNTLNVTTNGGATWTTVPFSLAYNNVAGLTPPIKFVDSTHLWAIGQLTGGWPRMESSSDGGVTWHVTSALAESNGPYSDFSFTDVNHGWVVGQDSTTQVGFTDYTSDGGQTWTERYMPSSVAVKSISFPPGSSTGWRVVEATSFLAGSALPLTSSLEITHDGTHWLPIQFPGQMQFLSQVHALDPLHAWVNGTDQLGRAAVFETYDGGGTWTSDYPDSSTGLVSASPPPPPGPFVPVPPVRICDTRAASAGQPANQCSGRRVGSAGNGGLETLDFQTAGLAGLPADPSQYSAVILHVTATQPDAASYVTNFASGIPRPYASNLNTAPNQTVGNLIEVATGSDGHLELFNAQGTTDLVVDVEGYVSANTNSGESFTGVTPFRACDTRAPSPTNATQCAGATMSAGSTREVQVTGLTGSGIPATGVSAVVLNATATGPNQASFLTLYPTGSARPLASSLNFAPGQTVANRVTMPVGPCSSGGGSCVTVYNYSGDVDVVLDISGYYSSASSTSANGTFTAMTPTRLCDTRAPSANNITMCAGTGLAGGTPLNLQLAGADGIPANAKAVVANVTVTDPTTSGYLTVYPGTATQPLASDVNFTKGQTVPNLVVAALGSDGSLSLYTSATTADVVVDIVGYYT